MGYNKRYLLTKIIKIQEITLENTKRGATQKWVYENIIKEAFFISKDTFDKYLSRNAKRELKELQQSLKTHYNDKKEISTNN